MTALESETLWATVEVCGRTHHGTVGHHTIGDTTFLRVDALTVVPTAADDGFDLWETWLYPPAVPLTIRVTSETAVRRAAPRGFGDADKETF